MMTQNNNTVEKPNFIPLTDFRFTAKFQSIKITKLISQPLLSELFLTAQDLSSVLLSRFKPSEVPQQCSLHRGAKREQSPSLNGIQFIAGCFLNLSKIGFPEWFQQIKISRGLSSSQICSIRSSRDGPTVLWDILAETQQMQTVLIVLTFQL